MRSTHTRSAVLYGAGGIGVVLTDVLMANGCPIERVFDDAAEEGSTLLGFPVEPTSSAKGDHFPWADSFVSIGHAPTRERIVSNLTRATFGVAIHPSVLLADSAQIGEGSILFHGSVVQARTKIGRHVIVNTAASIDHDCVVGNFAHIAPHATLCGLVSVGDRTEIGAGASIIPSIRVGSDCRIGAGAVVIRDVPDGATVVGNPGRIL